DPAAATLARHGGRAYVASALRPYLIAALADADERAPVLVVAADDRAARGLADHLPAWLTPRPLRLYPSLGVSYASHHAPPPPRRPLLRVLRPRARGRARDRGRRGGDRSRAFRPLAGRVRRLPRRRRPPPLRPPRRRAGGARRARTGAPVRHLVGPAGALPRPVRRHAGPLAARGRGRAREARPLRLPHRRRLAAPRRGRARRLQ